VTLVPAKPQRREAEAQPEDSTSAAKQSSGAQGHEPQAEDAEKEEELTVSKAVARHASPQGT
jgi:hypothetical protein